MALPADNLIQSISIVPCPESITPGTGYFTFSGKTDFTVENEEQAEVARCFSALFTQAAGFTPCVKVGEKKGKISFLTDDALKSEAYHLEITPRQIIVKASDTKGFFYALQTIRQLLPASIEGTAVAETADWSVPAMTIRISWIDGGCGPLFYSERESASYYRLYGNVENQYPASAFGG